MNADEVLSSRRSPWNLQSLDLRDVLDQVADGRIRVPAFQRDYRHSDDDVVDLLGSVGKGWPIGVLTLVEARGTISSGSRAVSGTDRTAASNKEPTHLIVDGQQRLTSLVQALRSRDPVGFVKPNGKPEHRLYYFDMTKALDADVPLSEAILSVRVNANGSPANARATDLRLPERQFTNLIFPVSRIFAFAEWMDDCLSWWEAKIQSGPTIQDVRTTCLDFQQTTVNPFVEYRLWVAVMDGGLPLHMLLRTYERANAHGSTVTPGRRESLDDARSIAMAI